MRSSLLLMLFGLTVYAADPAPVVIELYTSEGCSSCPAAETLLQEFSATDPHLLVITWHVTYWDHLGWKDPWGIPGAEVRQHAIATQTSGRMFTPQAIIQGRMSRVGSDRAGLIRAIADARTRGPAAHVEPQLTITTRNSSTSTSAPSCHASFSSFPIDAPITVLVLEDHLTSQVTAGENAGEKLFHDGVVRWWKNLAHDREVDVSLPENCSPDQVSVVAFAHTPQGTISAAGRARWPHQAP